MKYWQGAVIYTVAFILQPFLYNLIPGSGFTPNLIFCLSIIFTFVFDSPILGMSLGLIFSFAMDVCYGQYVGPGAVSLVLVCMAIFFARKFTNIENIVNVLIMTALSTFCFNSVYWIIYHLTGSPYGYFFSLRVLPGQILCNCIVVGIIYLLLIKKVIRYREDRYFK